MSIGRFFHNIAHPFVVLFGKIFGESARHEFAVAAEALLNSELGKLAWAAVQAAEQLAIDGIGKRADAFQKIELAAKQAGLEFKDSIVNMLIEIAVQKLKGNA
jgi:hypothetical protein